MAGPQFERIAVIGCGLIGSSLVRAVRAYGAAGSISVYDLSPVVRERVATLGIASSDPAPSVISTVSPSAVKWPLSMATK